jgi:hypothetical protein
VSTTRKERNLTTKRTKKAQAKIIDIGEARRRHRRTLPVKQLRDELVLAHEMRDAGVPLDFGKENREGVQTLGKTRGK